jgi:hypothetical protein
MNRTAKVKRMTSTIKKLKRERKVLIKTIDENQMFHAKEIAELNNERGEQVFHLNTLLSQTEEALKEARRKKWYQFRRIN